MIHIPAGMERESVRFHHVTQSDNLNLLIAHFRKFPFNVLNLQKVKQRITGATVVV